MSIEAMRYALAALEWNLPVIEDYGDKEQLNRQRKAITAIKQALEQPVQEPVAWCTKSDLENMAKGFSQDVPARSMRVPQLYPKEGAVLLYTTPPTAQPAPTVQEPVAWMHTGGHIQGRNPNWEQGIAGGYTRERGWTPLYTTPPAAPMQEPVGRVCFEGDEVVWTDEPPESGTLLYTTPPAQPAPVQQREAIKELADQYARECVEFSKAIQDGAHSMSPIAVKSGDTRLALHTAIDAITTPSAAPVQEPVAWMTINPYGEEDDIWYENPEGHLIEGWTYKPLYAHPAPVLPVAQAWAEGYRAGIDDERTSEANIGIAGMGMKVEPARNNPYRTALPAAPASWTEMVTANLVREGVNKHKARELAEHFYTTPPAAQRQWVGLTDEQIMGMYNEPRSDAEMIAFGREVEAKLKEKNA